MRVLVTSEKDIASQTIRDVLVNDYGFTDTGESFDGNPIMSFGKSALLITSSRELVESDHLEERFKVEAFIFCSRHRAQSGRPALLVHSTGNFGDEALFGGRPHELSVSVASLVGAALRRLHQEQEERGLDQFEVSMEVTHHGPTSMKTPLLFVELGSDETHWRNRDAAKAVAAAVLDCVSEPISHEAVIAFGGTHYATKFNNIVLEKRYMIGHIAPKHALDAMTVDVVHQMATRAREKTVAALVDWKGTNAEQKDRLLPMLEDLGIEIVRAKSS